MFALGGSVVKCRENLLLTDSNDLTPLAVSWQIDFVVTNQSKLSGFRKLVAFS